MRCSSTSCNRLPNCLAPKHHLAVHIGTDTGEVPLCSATDAHSRDSIGIVVYDEGHQFDSGSRGITYELLLTEIKALLPAGAQTVLVSAVIKNAQAIGEWLIGDGVQVVTGSGLLPTARSVAFASWIERLGQLMFFESETYVQPDYFVPRVIEQQALARRSGERTDRYFPDSASNDVALYLGIRLVSQGAVAIFCGRKDTASGIASRAVEVFERVFPSPHLLHPQTPMNCGG